MSSRSEGIGPSPFQVGLLSPAGAGSRSSTVIPSGRACQWPARYGESLRSFLRGRDRRGWLDARPRRIVPPPASQRALASNSSPGPQTRRPSIWPMASVMPSSIPIARICSIASRVRRWAPPALELPRVGPHLPDFLDRCVELGRDSHRQGVGVLVHDRHAHRCAPSSGLGRMVPMRSIRSRHMTSMPSRRLCARRRVSALARYDTVWSIDQ